jgi:hypothetical protein
MLFLWGLNRPGHEVDYATPPSAIINNAYSYNFCICLHGMSREDITFRRFDILTPKWMMIHFV